MNSLERNKTHRINSISCVLLLFFISCIKSVYAQEIVLAFDQTLGPATSLDGLARTKMLIKNMAKADVKQAMFLIRTQNLTQKTFDRVAHYDETGQLLVNAGHSYSIYLRQKSYAYPIDVMKANAELQPFFNYHQHVYFPYLLDGTDTTLKQQLQEFLASHGYLPTYTTTFVHDEYMDWLYQQRLLDNHTVDIRKLEKAYINMVLEPVKNYAAKAYLLLGFNPRQVLVLHETDLTAYCITGLIDELNKLGYKVIAPEKVFTDPVANPYFVSGYSAVSYMPYITGLREDGRTLAYVVTQYEQQKIHVYLQQQGLDVLIPVH